MNDLERSIKNYKLDREDLRKQWHQVENATFPVNPNAPRNLICPNCQYNLNQEMIDQFMEKNKG